MLRVSLRELYVSYKSYVALGNGYKPAKGYASKTLNPIRNTIPFSLQRQNWAHCLRCLENSLMPRLPTLPTTGLRGLRPARGQSINFYGP